MQDQMQQPATEGYRDQALAQRHRLCLHRHMEFLQVMRMIHRGHSVQREPGATGEIRLIKKQFGLAA